MGRNPDVEGSERSNEYYKFSGTTKRKKKEFTRVEKENSENVNNEDGP